MKRIGITVGGFFALTFFVIGYLMIFAARNESVTKETTCLFTVDGVLETDEVDVASKLPGRLAALYFREGDYVEAGQVLAELEAQEIGAKQQQAAAGLRAAQLQAEKGELAAELERRSAESKVTQAQASLAASEATLAMARQKLSALESGARPQEKAMAQQAVVAAQAQFDAAEKTWNRISTLADEGVVAQQRADEVEMKYLSAKAQLQAAQAQMDMVNEGARVEEVEAARQQVLQAEAGVEAAERTLQLAIDARMMVDIRLKDADAALEGVAASQGVLDEVNAYVDNTKITAPISGRITQRMSRAGEIVAPGYAILSITRTDGFWVEVFVDESDFAGRAPGEHVEVMIPATGKSFGGVVTQVMASAAFATKKATNESGSYDIRALQLRITLEGEPEGLASGLTARVCFK